MNTNLLDLILGQSWLHLISYGLVTSILFVALADAFVIRHLGKVLRAQGKMLRTDPGLNAIADEMVHPVARAATGLRRRRTSLSEANVRQQSDVAEAAIFIPLKARMVLTRDLSTLMGLIATLLALVAAASDFAKNGKPELLIGSVGTGCVATCVAAIGCALALWNLSRLTRTRLELAVNNEALFLDWNDHCALAAEEEVPIQVLGQPDEPPSTRRNHAHVR